MSDFFTVLFGSVVPISSGTMARTFSSEPAAHAGNPAGMMARAAGAVQVVVKEPAQVSEFFTQRYIVFTRRRGETNARDGRMLPGRLAQAAPFESGGSPIVSCPSPSG